MPITLNAEQAKEIKEVMLNGGDSEDARRLAAKFGCSMGAIFHIKAGRRWKEIEVEITNPQIGFKAISWQARQLPFWGRVKEQIRIEKNGCHIFTGHVDECGYARIHNGKRLVRVHREVWMRKSGKPIPKGMVIMHSCDTPACINPAHLSLGTQKDNVRDAMRKGRWNPRGPSQKYEL